MTIAPGDLVLCIRPPACCKSPEPLGGPYQVLAVRTEGAPGRCVWCAGVASNRGPEAQVVVRGAMGWMELYRLKKIWPLAPEERAAMLRLVLDRKPLTIPQ